MQAQNLCDNPAGQGFTITPPGNKICVGQTITVKPNNTAEKGVNYSFDYSKSGVPTNLTVSRTSPAYTTPGSYTILQIGTAGAGATNTCAVIQVVNTPPINFQFRTCPNRLVTLDFTLDAEARKYDQVVIDWGDGSKDTKTPAALASSLSHTYANGSTRAVSVYGVYTGACTGQPTSQPVTPNTNATQDIPLVTKLDVQEGKLVLTYQASTGATIELLQKDPSGAYQPVSQTANGSGELSVAADTKQVQCFKLRSKDACGNGVESAEVCSLSPTAKAESQMNVVTWDPYAGTGVVRLYRIYSNGSPVGVTTSSTSFTDSPINCGQKYCYSIEATIGQTTVNSAPVCVTGINTTPPDPPRNTQVSVLDNGQPELFALPPATGGLPQYTVQILRSGSPSGPFAPVAELKNTLRYQDDKANTNEQSYCYQMVYLGTCGLQSKPTNPVCTVWLSSQAADVLNWTPDSPFALGPVGHYTLRIQDTVQTSNNIDKDVGLNTAYAPDVDLLTIQTVRFQVIAVSADGKESRSNYFILRQNPKINTPTAFTPGDANGINDTFEAKGLFWEKFEMTIFNRWGEAIYNTTDRKQGWDGNVNGQPAPAGNYVYRIEIEDLTGQRSVKTGSVLLIR